MSFIGPIDYKKYTKYMDMLKTGKNWGEVANLAKKETGSSWGEVDSILNKDFWAKGGAYKTYQTSLQRGQDISGFDKYAPSQPTQTIQPNTNNNTVSPNVSLAAQIAAARAEQERRDGLYQQYLREELESRGLSGNYVESPFDEAGARMEAEKLWNPFAEDQKTRLSNLLQTNQRGVNEDYDRTAALIANQKEGQQVSNAASQTNITNSVANRDMARSGLGMRDINLTKLAGDNRLENINMQGEHAGQIKTFNLDKLDQEYGLKQSDLTNQVNTGIRTDLELARQRWRERETKRITDFNNAQNIAQSRLGY